MKALVYKGTRKVSIEDVPEWRVKTPLQRSVQILKRHRDIYFQQKPEVRPVSVLKSSTLLFV